MKFRQNGSIRIAAAALAAAMLTAGAAVAADRGSGEGTGDGGRAMRGPGSGGPGGPGGPGPGPAPFMKNLTNGELHVQKNGQDVVIRLDQGKVKSVAGDSITITENDGQDMTVPTDSDTKVLVPRNRDADLDDLKSGQKVVIDREQGEPANAVAVLPAKVKGHKGPRGQRPAPPAPPLDN